MLPVAQVLDIFANVFGTVSGIVHVFLQLVDVPVVSLEGQANLFLFCY